jgi:hypothetical protein
MANFSDLIIYEQDGKKYTYEDLLKEIHESNEETADTIRALAEKLISLVDSPAAAVSLMEHINKLFSSKVKNDELLIRLAAILGRVIRDDMKTSGDDTDPFGLTDSEKQLLLEEARQELQKFKGNESV